MNYLKLLQLLYLIQIGPQSQSAISRYHSEMKYG